jgi:hypothetical protein
MTEQGTEGCSSDIHRHITLWCMLCCAALHHASVLLGWAALLMVFVSFAIVSGCIQSHKTSPPPRVSFVSHFDFLLPFLNILSAVFFSVFLRERAW